MGTNPFEDAAGSYFVLVNAVDEHALWPASVPVPAGWRIVAGPAGRQSALGHVERNWTGRPATVHARE
ncbi:MbtH family protein [Amycolatopsis tolypomycina]|uniref:MbtH protein n=1 Tax=Amycolatopsis tolypomycina TaxID=208445 RepID=A0A1H4TY61_9PSEU|nr:MbtH family protein [Amycolatopsis tolypomycina]SEC61369.1 MbtH protein [Amycolatopsis tolypomycina]